MHVNICNSIEKHCPVFFSPICVSYSRNNVCKRTVFPKLELRRNVICKPLSWNKKQLFAYVISQIRNTNRQKKILDNVFQSNCNLHAELLTYLRKIVKRPKMRHKLNYCWGVNNKVSHTSLNETRKMKEVYWS